MTEPEVNFLSLVDAILDDRTVKPAPRPKLIELDEEVVDAPPPEKKPAPEKRPAKPKTPAKTSGEKSDGPPSGERRRRRRRRRGPRGPKGDKGPSGGPKRD